jgi:hypothetical protein
MKYSFSSYLSYLLFLEKLKKKKFFLVKTHGCLLTGVNLCVLLLEDNNGFCIFSLLLIEDSPRWDNS